MGGRVWRVYRYLGPRKPKSSYLKPGIGTLSVVAIAGWVLTSHSPTHGGRGRQPDVHVLSTDYHRGHLDLLKCHWGDDFLDECLTAVLGCLLRYPTPVRTPSCLWLIWPTGTINLVPAKLGSLKWRRPFLPGRSLIKTTVSLNLRRGRACPVLATGQGMPCTCDGRGQALPLRRDR